MRYVIIVAACFLVFGFLYCKKENNNYRSNATITGPDVGMCICCGGWIIKIEDMTYRFDSIPAGSNINLQKDSFPINVKLDWQFISSDACLNKISIQRIARE
jgi:hypothetical protein